MNQIDTATPAEWVRIEARALEALALRLDGAMAESFRRAVDCVVHCGEAHRRVVLTGMGKSGIIARKIAATFSSTGSPAIFLHPAEAVHGDLGVIERGDVVIALSSSGETEELLRLLPLLKRTAEALISFCSAPVSTLARSSDILLDTSVEREACAMGLAPTASTTAMLALGDALAIAVSQRKGFRREDFRALHPAGRLGRKLSRARDLMHSGDAIPRVERKTGMPSVIYEMSRKGLGITLVTDRAANGEMLAGIISDGDLRRLLEQRGAEALALSAGEAMNPTPKTIPAEELAARALKIMETNKITSLVVLEEAGSVAGVLHLHDLWGLELI